MDAILDLRLHLLPHLLVCIYQGEPLVYLPHHALALSAWQWGLAVHVCTHLRVPTSTALHCVVAVAHYNCISVRSHTEPSSSLFTWALIHARSCPTTACHPCPCP